MVLHMSMKQTTFSPLLAMTQACLIYFLVYEPFRGEWVTWMVNFSYDCVIFKILRFPMGGAY